MDADPSTHPTPETLQAYGLGKLDDASAEVVSKHLEDCPDCRRQVAEMAPDSFLGRLRDAQERPETSASGPAIPVDRRPERRWLMMPSSILRRLRACLPRAKSTRRPTL